jgi:hypothetical protein
VRYLRGGPAPRLHLNAFRGEPAISGFAWHFTPTLRSSLPFVTDTGSGLHARVPRASPCPRVDHPVSGRLNATCRPFGLAFAPAPAVRRLNLATPNHSLAHSTKGTPSRFRAPTGRRHMVSGSISLPSVGVLFTVPSRYWFAIGRIRYLALGRGRPCFPPDFACPAVLTIMSHRLPVLAPTGLSPSPVAPSSGVRLQTVRQRPPCRSVSTSRTTPPQQRRQPRNAGVVWAPPGSLAATTGILSVPRGT